MCLFIHIHSTGNTRLYQSLVFEHDKVHFKSSSLVLIFFLPNSYEYFVDIVMYGKIFSPLRRLV